MKHLNTILMAALLFVVTAVPSGAGITLCERMQTIHLQGGCSACTVAETQDSAPDCCQQEAEETPTAATQQFTLVCCQQVDLPAPVNATPATSDTVAKLAPMPLPTATPAFIPEARATSHDLADYPRPPPLPAYLAYCSLLI